MAKVSVIVPVYKSEKYLKDCVASIQAQTHPDLEIILVDDGSPDSCPDMCDMLAQDDERIVVIHKPNGGVSSARNAGLDAMKGDYVCFVDSDDMLHPEFVSFLLKGCEENNCEMAYCDMTRFVDTSEIQHEPILLEKQECKAFDTKYALENFFSTWMCPYVWNKLMKRELLDNIRFPSFARAEDLYFVFSLLKKDFNIFGMKHCKLYYYRHTPNSAMTDRKLAFDDVNVRLNVFEWLESLQGLESTKYRFAIQTRGILVDIIPSRFGKAALEYKNEVLPLARRAVKEMFLKVKMPFYKRVQYYLLYVSPISWRFIRAVLQKIFKISMYR